MFSYYGSKRSIVNYYPPPKYGVVIEPFAGAANYSLKYFDRDVVLVDKYKVVVDVWKFLQECSEGDIDRLPHFLTEDDRLSDFNFSYGEGLLMGFLIGCGLERPRNKPSARATTLRPKRLNSRLNFIRDNLFKIRHWDIRLGSYVDLENIEATWFIDPPYEDGGSSYVCSDIDYGKLGDWCKERSGHVIVCENYGASWMDFRPMILNRGTHKSKVEGIWSNYPTAFDNIQGKLF